MNLLWIYIDMPADDPEPENEIFPEIIVDETDYIPSDEEPEPEPEPEPVVPEQPVQIEPPQQDDMFQTGKPVKKKRQVSEKQRQHLDRIRIKALERKKEKADARKKEKQAVDTHNQHNQHNQPQPQDGNQSAIRNILMSGKSGGGEKVGIRTLKRKKSSLRRRGKNTHTCWR